MVVILDKQINSDLPTNFLSAESVKTCVARVVEHIKKYQLRIRKHIEDNYAGSMPNEIASDKYIDQGSFLFRETEHLLLTLGEDGNLSQSETKLELEKCVVELQEVSLGLKISNRILKIDDLLQCVEYSNAKKDNLAVLELLEQLKEFISNASNAEFDRMFKKCECYEAIKVKYHVQTNILQQNLEQKFDGLVQFSENKFQAAIEITMKISKDFKQLQDTVVALFRARYDPMTLCQFLLNKCLAPMITKPVIFEQAEESEEFFQLNIMYSLDDSNKNLRPTYKHVIAQIKKLLEYLSNMNVRITPDKYVFSIIGSHTMKPLLAMLVTDCLMNAVPETMDEYADSTLPTDVLKFEKNLDDLFLIDSNVDTQLSDFVKNYNVVFRQTLSTKILENARAIMQKNLQDMILGSKGDTICENNSSPLSQYAVSRNTQDLVKLMETALRQPMNSSSGIDDDGEISFLDLIPIILNTYCSEVPKLHEKLLESIPQQAALFYNNCMFLSHWVSENSGIGIPAYSKLVEKLQSTGEHTFKSQLMRQKNILFQILSDLDISDTHSIGTVPFKLIRQCLRQIDLLKYVWVNVLPDDVYFSTFCNILTEFAQDILERILSLSDISATVASELSDLIDVILSKAPELLKEKHQMEQIPNWRKLQELKFILNASLNEIPNMWCNDSDTLTANYQAEEVRHLIRALFQNTDRRAKALAKIF